MKKVLLAAAALVAVMGANASTTTYTSPASFQAAAVTNTLATFEVTAGAYSSLTDGGVKVTPLPGADAYSGATDIWIASAGNLYFKVPNASRVLTSDGTENFRFERQDGATFSAIGFDFYSNTYSPQTFNFYDASGSLIGSESVTQETTKGTLGYLGFTSTTPIAYMTSNIIGGGYVNTGFDNVAIGSAVPEPETYALMLSGLAALRLVRRRKA